MLHAFETDMAHFGARDTPSFQAAVSSHIELVNMRLKQLSHCPNSPKDVPNQSIPAILAKRTLVRTGRQETPEFGRTTRALPSGAVSTLPWVQTAPSTSIAASTSCASRSSSSCASCRHSRSHPATRPAAMTCSVAWRSVS